MKKEDILSTLDSVTGAAKELSAEALKASRSFAESAKKTIQTEKLDYQISRKYIEIGKIVYSAYEEEGSYDHVADEVCEEINALFDQIIAIKLGEAAEYTEEEKEEIINEVNETIDDTAEEVQE